MNKVFIPDNEGGGTWETWKDDRLSVSLEDARRAVAYKAHAEKLAQALRKLRKSIRHAHNCKAPQAFPCSCDADKLWDESEATLKAYEASRQ